MSKLPKDLKLIKSQLLDVIGENSEALLELLIEEAKGGRKVYTRKFVAAGTLLLPTKDGPVEQFPDKNPEELVLVEVTEKELPPNTVLLQYLLDKITGRTPQSEELPNTNNITINMNPSHKELKPVAPAIPNANSAPIEEIIPAEYRVLEPVENVTTD